MNVPNIADNPYVSLADLRDQNNGEEFLEKCVKNWNAWVEMTQNLNEVEERNNTLIVEQSNLAKQLDTSLRVNKDLQQQILVRINTYIQVCYFSLPLQINIFAIGRKKFRENDNDFQKNKKTPDFLFFTSKFISIKSKEALRYNMCILYTSVTF